MQQEEGSTPRVEDFRTWGELTRIKHEGLIKLISPQTEGGHLIRWMQVVPVVDEAEQQRLKREYDKKQAAMYRPPEWDDDDWEMDDDN